ACDVGAGYSLDALRLRAQGRRLAAARAAASGRTRSPRGDRICGVSSAAEAVSAAPSSASAPKPSLFVLDPGLPRFAWVLLCYVLGLAGLATLSPFDFDLANPHAYTWVTTRSDVALNLAFLFPVGFLLRLARGERAWPWALDALALGVLVSCTLELTQLLLPSRFSSPTDVITNGLGAWAGGAAHLRIGRYLDRRLQRQLSLHLPLANLLYLSFPLLALEGLSAFSWDGCLPVLALTLFVAEIAAGLYKHRLEGVGKPFANAFSCAIALSFGIAYMPIVVGSLPIWLGSTVFAGLASRFVIAFGTRLPATERRFVPATIKRAAPFFLLYVLLLGAHGFFASHWHISRVLGLGSSAIYGAQVSAMGLLRDVTAFTLLGYLGSELQARWNDATPRIVARVLAVAVPAAVFVGGLRSRSIDLTTVSHIGWMMSGALAGASIHRAQLRLVRSWSRNSHRPPA
ncbi:MAG TPA: VanZ family protein, partial [Polyangiales bacterium]|nr:VanZ family protein [Polyangiales bacterium]